MSATTQHGYLLIADISGYTSFVARTELEHSHEILSDLLGVVCEHMEALLTFHKLEGDAVFAYAPEVKIPRGETLLELIESTYVAFRDKQVSMKRATTCTCNACLNIPSLDLKFIAHHGEYILQQIRDIREMIGSDVNLVHRLLKNNVTEATGWRAYMLFTEPCLEHMHINLEDAHQQMESYEHLAEVRTYSLDLHKRYHEIVETRRVMLDKDEADVILTLDFNVPPPVAWDWMQSPTKRNLWGRGVQWSGGDRPRGRTGSGASNHCAHGKGVSTEIVLDWRPFEYSTTESYNGGKKMMTDTLRFDALPGGGTRVHDLMKFEMPLPRPLRRIAARLMTKMMKMEEMGQQAARLAADEYNRNKETDES
jgi:class 3 adenylate cyclase